MSVDLRGSSAKISCRHRIGAEGDRKGTEKSISISFKTMWIISASRLPLLTSATCQLIWSACTSLSLSDITGERCVYWFLKTNSFMEWACLKEKLTWKRRMPQSCIFRIVQRRKNLFFIRNENVFLDGAGSLECSILVRGDQCLQCILSWSDHKVGIVFESRRVRNPRLCNQTTLGSKFDTIIFWLWDSGKVIESKPQFPHLKVGVRITTCPPLVFWWGLNKRVEVKELTPCPTSHAAAVDDRALAPKRFKTVSLLESLY